jgi:hypothetical protein
MAEFSISVDMSSVMQEVGSIINEEVLPLLSQAVRAVAGQFAANWQESVQRANLWSGEKDKYVAAISWKSTGPFSASVESTYEYDQEIEAGRPAYDLKTMLSTSQKVRTSKKGKRYLIIPFRHGTPGTNTNEMPEHVYAEARQLTPSRITGQGSRPAAIYASQTGQRQVMRVATRSYSWGGKLPAGLTQKLRPYHATDIHASMVRFDTTTPKGSRYSSYGTFRTMVEGSNKWILPPKDGLRLVEKVTSDMRPLAEKVFIEALRRTISG